MKRLTLAGVAVYVLMWVAIAAAYFVAWLTDFERGDV